MNKEQIKKSLEELKKEKKRNFKQRLDLIITLKDFNIKANPIDIFHILPHSNGKKVKICGIVAGELFDQSTKTFETTLSEKDFDKYQGKKKEMKTLADNYTFFVAQANLMSKIAQVFGRIFGPKGKMPNPKAGCVVPPNANLEILKNNLQKIVRVTAKTQPVIQVSIGNEEMKDDELIDNIISVYQALIKQLPNEENNVKKTFLKKTMSKPTVIE